MTPLFISYVARPNISEVHNGWVVCDTDKPITTGKDVDALCRQVEKQRGWPDGCLTIVSFQRLEPTTAPKAGDHG